jgi:hypothetical protein
MDTTSPGRCGLTLNFLPNHGQLSSTLEMASQTCPQLANQISSSQKRAKVRARVLPEDAVFESMAKETPNTPL